MAHLTSTGETPRTGKQPTAGRRTVARVFALSAALWVMGCQTASEPNAKNDDAPSTSFGSESVTAAERGSTNIAAQRLKDSPPEDRLLAQFQIFGSELPPSRRPGSVAPFVTFVSTVTNAKPNGGPADDEISDTVALYNAGPTTIRATVLCVVDGEVHDCVEGTASYESALTADSYSLFPISIPMHRSPNRLDVVLLMDKGQKEQLGSVSSVITRPLDERANDNGAHRVPADRFSAPEVFAGCDLVSFVSGDRNPAEPYVPLRTISAEAASVDVVLELCDTRYFGVYLLHNEEPSNSRLERGFAGTWYTRAEDVKSYRSSIDLDGVMDGDVLQAFLITDAGSGRTGLFTLPLEIKSEGR